MKHANLNDTHLDTKAQDGKYFTLEDAASLLGRASDALFPYDDKEDVRSLLNRISGDLLTEAKAQDHDARAETAKMLAHMAHDLRKEPSKDAVRALLLSIADGLSVPLQQGHRADDDGWKAQRKAEKLAHYQARDPRDFIQYDGFDQGDCVTGMDGNGQGVMSVSTTELMHGTDVRVLIPRDGNVSGDRIVMLLKRITEWIESDGLHKGFSDTVGITLTAKTPTPPKETPLQQGCRVDDGWKARRKVEKLAEYKTCDPVRFMSFSGPADDLENHIHEVPGIVDVSECVELVHHAYDVTVLIPEGRKQTDAMLAHTLRQIASMVERDGVGEFRKDYDSKPEDQELPF